jgi:hypothetical protein
MSIESVSGPTPRRLRDMFSGAILCCLLTALSGPLAAAQPDTDAEPETAAPATSLPPADSSPAPPPSAAPAIAPAAPDGEQPQGTAKPSAPADNTTEDQDRSPRWIDAVRAQRRAMQQRRRAEHEARRRAIDPVGTARQEARDQEFQRRRQEMRERIAEDRKLFLNSGPWRTPLPKPPEFAPNTWPEPPGLSPVPNKDHGRPDFPDAGSQAPLRGDPAEWDNGWYYRGW